MSCNYYPAGMSYEDLVYVGEIDDPDACPSWFDESVNDEGVDLILDLWEEFLDACGPEGHYVRCASSAAEFMENRYPEYFTGYAA